MEFQLTAFENKRTFMKKAVLHTTTLIHCKARQASHDLFSSNQGSGSYMTFVAWATKISPKSLKTWRHQLYSEERFELLTNSGRNLIELVS